MSKDGASEELLEVRDLKVHFPVPKAHFFAPAQVVHAVDGVSFSVRRGATFGVVGESGSGKTTTALAVLRLAPITSGSVRLGELELSALEGDDLRRARSRVQIIFQDPYSSLNPRARAGAILCQRESVLMPMTHPHKCHRPSPK